MAGGILVSYIMGSQLAWDQLAWASAVFPALLLFVMLPLPESPVWLISRGKLKEADKALKWLNHPPRQAMDGIALRETTVYTVSDDKPPPEKEKMSSGFSKEELLRRPVLVPFALSFMLLIFQQVSGIDAIIFYTVSIFESSGSQVNNYLATILVGLIQLVANFLSLFVVDRAGRKPLLMASGALMCVSLAAMGTHFYFQRIGKSEDLGLLPLISLMVFMVGFSIGYCSIPFLLMGELIPEKQRSLLSSVAGSLNLGMMFVVIKTYHDLKTHLGEDVTFWIYSVVCLASCFFVHFLVPETKGKSLEEIEQLFELKQEVPLSGSTVKPESTEYESELLVKGDSKKETSVPTISESVSMGNTSIEKVD